MVRVVVCVLIFCQVALVHLVPIDSASDAINEGEFPTDLEEKLSQSNMKKARDCRKKKLLFHQSMRTVMKQHLLDLARMVNGLLL